MYNSCRQNPLCEFHISVFAGCQPCMSGVVLPSFPMSFNPENMLFSYI